jgi:hypothetical protein
LISGSNQFEDIGSDKNQIDVEPSTSSGRLIVIQSTPQDQMSIRQSVIEVPQAADNNLVNKDVQEFTEIVE